MPSMGVVRTRNAVPAAVEEVAENGRKLPEVRMPKYNTIQSTNTKHTHTYIRVPKYNTIQGKITKYTKIPEYNTIQSSNTKYTHKYTRMAEHNNKVQLQN